VFDLSAASSVAQIASVIVAFGVSAYGVYRRIDKRQQKVELDLVRVTEKLDFIVRQFGNNGGGLRQAVNELTDKICQIEQRQIQIGDKVARLDGKFEQHIVEND
jgi:hypothetical protein